MPRNIDPAGLTTGNGVLPPGSVEDSSLKNPFRDTRPLEAHVKDPSEAHMADAIRIEDTGGYYTSDETEGALQDIGGTVAGGRTNGVVSGGTWTSAGNVLTLDATTVIVGASLVTLTGDQITLPDGVRWVYVDPTTSQLASSTSPPALTGEPVILAKVVTTTGTIDTAASQDARFFVPQLDRKPPLTLRSSENALNANAEGCFMTLEAALLWLETYSTASDSEMETTTIIVRGNITLSATATLPIGGIRFVGDGSDSAFVTGATVSPMIDLAGKDRVKFEGMTFRCEHTGSTAIHGGATAVSDLFVHNCRFPTGAQDWVRCIDVDFATGTNQVVVRDSVFEASDVAILVDRPDDCLFDNLRVTEQGSSGTYGLQLNPSGPFAAEGSTHVTNCHVTGFGENISFAGDGSTIRGCTLEGAGRGVVSLGGQVQVSDCNIALDANTALTGIQVSGETLVSNCIITCTRDTWAAEVPVGVEFLSGSTRSRVRGCTISGFVNGTSGRGVGFPSQAGNSTVSDCHFLNCADGVHIPTGCQQIAVVGNTFDDVNKGVAVVGATGATTHTHDISISGNTFKANITRSVDVSGAVSNLDVVGNSIDNGLPSNIYTPTAEGVYVGANVSNTPEYINISDNTIFRCTSGVIVRGDNTSDTARYVTIQGNHIHHCAMAQDISGPIDTFVGRGTKGIGLEFCDSPVVQGNTLVKIGASIDDAGVGGWANGGGSLIDIQARAIYARNCNGLKIEGNSVLDTVANDAHVSGWTLPYGIFTEVHSTGLGADYTVEGCTISQNRIFWNDGLSGVAGGGEYGIVAEVSQGTDTFANALHDLQIVDNTIHRCRRSGILVQFSGGCVVSTSQVSRNKISLTCQVDLSAPSASGEQAGIQYELMNAGTGTITLVDTQIHDNQIDDSGWTASTSGEGIQVTVDRDGTIQNLSVCRNTVLRSENSGIFLEGTSQITSGNSSFGGWVVSDNIVRTTTSGSGVKISLGGSGTGSDVLQNLAVKNNLIRSTTSDGINVLPGKDLIQAHFSGNTIEDVAYGVIVSGNQVTPGISENISIVDNTVVACSGGVYIRGYDQLQNVNIRGNTVQGFTSKGIWFIADDASESLSIDGNVLRSASPSVTGLDIDLPDATITTMSISHNNLRLAGGTDTSMDITAAGASASQATMVFVGNVFFGGTTGATAGSNFAPDRSQCSCNVERTAGGAGNWGNGVSGFTSVFTNSTTANNQD